MKINIFEKSFIPIFFYRCLPRNKTGSYRVRTVHSGLSVRTAGQYRAEHIIYLQLASYTEFFTLFSWPYYDIRAELTQFRLRRNLYWGLPNVPRERKNTCGSADFYERFYSCVQETVKLWQTLKHPNTDIFNLSCDYSILVRNKYIGEYDYQTVGRRP